MSDVVNQANGQSPDGATLSFPGGTAQFPIRRAVDGASSIDLSTLTRQTGLTALDYGFVNTASTQSKITYIDGEQGILRIPPTERLMSWGMQQCAATTSRLYSGLGRFGPGPESR